MKNTKEIEIADNIGMLYFELNAARVFFESFNDKLERMKGLFDDAEQNIFRAEARSLKLKKLLEDD